MHMSSCVTQKFKQTINTFRVWGSNPTGTTHIKRVYTFSDGGTLDLNVSTKWNMLWNFKSMTNHMWKTHCSRYSVMEPNGVTVHVYMMAHDNAWKSLMKRSFMFRFVPLNFSYWAQLSVNYNSFNLMWHVNLKQWGGNIILRLQKEGHKLQAPVI